MAKLILSMDGLVLKEILLDKERLTIGERHGVIEGPLIEKPARARGPGQQHPARAAAGRFAHGDKLGAPGIM